MSVDKKLDRKLVDLLDVKNKHGLDNDKFLVLLGLVNLMGIINLLEERAAESSPKDNQRRNTPEKVPLMSMFAGPRGGPQRSDEQGK